MAAPVQKPAKAPNVKLGGAKAPPAGKRGAARLAAVQALYQLDMNGGKPAQVIAEFVEHRLGRELDGDQYGGADEHLFRAIAAGASAKREELDNLIAAVLPDAWPLERLESILRQILRCGVYELGELPEIPTPVVISEYVSIADAFFADGKQPGMVNAVLDRLARELRADRPREPRPDSRGGKPPAA